MRNIAVIYYRGISRIVASVWQTSVMTYQPSLVMCTAYVRGHQARSVFGSLVACLCYFGSGGVR